MNIAELKTRLNSLEKDILECQSEIDNFEYIMSDEDFADFLDDMYESVKVAGMEFYPSDILKNCDTVAYRCIKSDIESGFDLRDIAEYQELQEKLDDLQCEQDVILERIAELKSCN